MKTALPEVPTSIYTDRLLLRTPEKSDAQTVNAAILASIHDLKLWLPFAQTIPTLEETENNLTEARAHFLENIRFRYLMFDKKNGDFIGVVSFQTVDWEVSKSEIGYWTNSQFSGKGYMTEAVDALTKLGLNSLKFNRIEIRCERENHKSRAIPERLNFELEGILKNEDLSADKKRLTDTCIYAITQY